MATKVRFSDTKEMAQAAAEQMVLGTDLNTFRSNLISSYAPAVGAGLKSHLGALQGVQSQVTEAKKTIQSDISGAYSTYLQNQMALARNQNLMAGYKANISDAYANAMAISKGTVADAYKAAEAAGAAGVAEQMSAWEGLKQQYNKSIEKTYSEAADVVAKEQKWATQAFDATIQALYDATGGDTRYFTDIGDDENELYTLSQEGDKLLFDSSDAAKGEFKLSELGKQLLATQFGDTSTGMDKYFKASHFDDYDAEKSLAFKKALLGETWETDYEDYITNTSANELIKRHNTISQLENKNTKFSATTPENISGSLKLNKDLSYEGYDNIFKGSIGDYTFAMATAPSVGGTPSGGRVPVGIRDSKTGNIIPGSLTMINNMKDDYKVLQKDVLSLTDRPSGNYTYNGLTLRKTDSGEYFIDINMDYYLNK